MEMAQRSCTQTGMGEARESYDSAFVQVYQNYYTRVFAFVYSAVGNMETSKDLTADIFERAYTKGHGLREPAAYRAWLFVITRNVVLGHYRWHKRAQRHGAHQGLSLAG